MAAACFNGSHRTIGCNLGDLCLRISCGVATGADGVFVRPADGLDPALRRFAHPTVAGRQLTPATGDLPRNFVILIPYDVHVGSCR